MTIGTVSGAPEYQFHRIQDVVRTRDGSIVVIDGSRTVRLYDGTGAHVWTAGGEGDGPGEFRYPYSVLELAADSVGVWDGRVNRLSVFTGEGQYVRSVTVSALDLPTAAWGLTGRGELLVEARRVERTVIGGHTAILHPSDFYLVGVNGEISRNLGRRMYAIGYQEIDENGAFSSAIFATEAVVAPSADGLWYGDAEDYELREEVGADETRRIIRWQGPDRTISDADVKAVLAKWSEGAEPEVRSYLAEYGRTHPRADKFPAYEQLIMDQPGRLWIQNYVRDHLDDGWRYWMVLSSAGTELLARVKTPAAIEIHDIGDDWLLGVTQDELGVGSVVLLAIVSDPERTLAFK
ncbi:MAG TPA: hypothetical protein VMM79_14585 [Longimicrobiales bacterium]|nr:hypothetical protein [Longimicrobiales bacterium]